jgi:hypothetical protein
MDPVSETVYFFTYVRPYPVPLTNGSGSGSNSGSDFFLCDAKKNSYFFIAYPQGSLSSALKFKFFAKILLQNFIFKQSFSPLNIFMRKGKDPDSQIDTSD